MYKTAYISGAVILTDYASLTTRSDTYYIDFYDSGREPRRKRLSLKTASESVAERLKVKLEDAYAAGTWGPWIHTVGDFHGRPAKPKTLQEGKRLYKYTLNGLLRAVGKRTPLERLTAAQIGSYTQDEEALSLHGRRVTASSKAS